MTAWRLPTDDGDWVVRVPRLVEARVVVEAQHCLGLRLEAHGLPVPLDSRLLRDADGELVAGLYRFADGRRGDVSGRTDRRRLAHTLGEFLSRLHALDPRIAIECGAKPYEPWGDVYEPMIGRCGPVLPPRSRAWIEAVGQRLRAASRALPPLVLVHADLKPEHVLLDASDDLLAVLDFEGARVTDPATDFARLHQHWGGGFAAQALERYSRVIDEGFALRARCYADLDPLELLDVSMRRGSDEWIRVARRTLAARAAAETRRSQRPKA